MQSFLEAAKAKGMNATGMKLNISELRENMITINDGMGHYTIIREITNDTVKLADPSLGNIELRLQDFHRYTQATPSNWTQTQQMQM